MATTTPKGSRGASSRDGEVSIRRIMTADVAQAVERLRQALGTVDRIDDAILSSRTPTERERAREQRREAIAALAKRRAELDTILLGPES